MKIEGGTVTLSSGRTFEANRGLLSLSEDGVVHDGYDGSFDFLPDDIRDDDDMQPWTPAERREIAEYMIARWAAWGGTVRGETMRERLVYRLVQALSAEPFPVSDGDFVLSLQQALIAADLAGMVEVSRRGSRSTGGKAARG